jgi:hypothetical protein
VAHDGEARLRDFGGKVSQVEAGVRGWRSTLLAVSSIRINWDKVVETAVTLQIAAASDWTAW